MTKLMKRLRLSAGPLVLVAAFLGAILVAPSSQAAVVASDGGVTFWISFDNLDSLGFELSDTLTEANVLPGGFSCGATNTGRSDVGAANSPGSCPGGASTCTGQEKITGDITKLATYIAQATEGTHYLRRVYVSDAGRAWDSADIKWNVGGGGSSAPYGWNNSDKALSMNSAYRTCIHDVVHHELGHYFYNLPDRYVRLGDYYKGTMPGDATVFNVDTTVRDINTVMSNNFPHFFVDTTNASITIDYNPPGPGSVTGEVLTPNLLTDGDASNDGPNRAHHGHTMPFAQDEWSLVPNIHADLTGVHTEGTFAAAVGTPAVDIVFIGDDEPHPGTALLLDRSGSMGVTTNGITAAQFVQEAGMFLYHSSQDADLVGTYLYNASVEDLFPYAVYDETNDLPLASFRNASGLTNIAAALETAIDALIAEHGEGGVSGSEIYLMSDGRQTTGASLWDQVTRANERGIKIHTFSFGNADTTTMDDIASGSGGSTTPMSEREDAAELKMLMTRKFSTGRGRTPVFVFKGIMREKINLGAMQLYVGQFAVPPKTRDLQFYTFLHQGDASDALTIRLEAPGGANFSSPTPGNIEKKGRFNGVKVDGPVAGLWTFILASKIGSGLPSEPIEIAAYADNRELKGNVWFDDITSGGDVLLRASLNFRYPLTRMKVKATVYAAGVPIAAIPMYDNGTGGDENGNDGIYSADFNVNESNWGKRLGAIERSSDKLRIEAEFVVDHQSLPAPSAHYETGFTPEMANRDYLRGNKSAFKAWATTVLNLAQARPDRPNLQPRFDTDTIKGMIKVQRDIKGKLNFALLNARPLTSQMRVSLGQGVVAQVSAVQDERDDARKTVRQTKQDNKNKDLKRVQRPIRVEKVDPKVRVPSRTARPDPVGPTRTHYVVDYYIANDAKSGRRNLLIQFGDIIVERQDVLSIE